MDNPETARRFLEASLRKADEINATLTVQEAARQLIKIAKSGSPEFSHYNKLIKAQDTLRKNEIKKIMLIKDLENEKKHEKLSRNILYLIIVLILIISILMFLNYSDIERKNRLLQNQKNELEKAYKDIEQLSEIGKLITSSLSVEEIVTRVYDSINELMDATVFSIGIYNENEKRLEFPGTREYRQELPFKYYDLTETNRLAVHCFLNETEIRFGDYQNEYKKYIDQIMIPKTGQSFNSHIFLPLIMKDIGIKGRRKKIGVINVQSPILHAFAEYHYNILKTLAVYVAIAIENAKVYHQLEIQNEKLEMSLEKEMEINLKKEELIKQKDEFVNTVSHQYKTPITIIQSSAEIIQDNLPQLKREEISSHIRKIKDQLDRMVYLLNELLLHGKPFKPGDYDIVMECRKTVEQFEINEGKQHNIAFFSEQKNKLMFIDKNFLEIILKNLLVNAAHYSPPKSHIEIKLSDHDQNFLIQVSDQGIGIPEEDIGKIFKRFQRGSNVANIEGTGLGLSLVKRYVEQHGGKVEIRSKENAGTTFFIYFPIKQKNKKSFLGGTYGKNSSH
jgi:signal transduction histidine kinase